MQSTETAGTRAASDRTDRSKIGLGLPKGRMQDGVLRLFAGRSTVAESYGKSDPNSTRERLILSLA